jgi:hypothetical protein
MQLSNSQPLRSLVGSLQEITLCTAYNELKPFSRDLTSAGNWAGPAWSKPIVLRVKQVRVMKA